MNVTGSSSSRRRRHGRQFEIYKDQGGQYRFRLKGRNGAIVATGESYPTKAGTKKGVQAVQKAAEGAAKVVDITEG